MALTYRVPDDCHAVELDGRACVYRASREDVVILSQTATRIWQLAPETPEVGLVSQLCREFQAEPVTIERDLGKALSDLVESGVLEVRP